LLQSLFMSYSSALVVWCTDFMSISCASSNWPAAVCRKVAALWGEISPAAMESHQKSTANATTYLKHQRVSFVEECLFKQFCYNCSTTVVHDLHISSLSSAHMEAACSISNDQQDVYRLLYFSKIVFCKTSFSLWQHVLEAVSFRSKQLWHSCGDLSFFIA